MHETKLLPVYELPHEGDPAVSGVLHLPAEPSGNGLVLTHGAGANCQSPLLVALARRFCDSGWTVLRCDLPFRQQRPNGPPARGSAERDRLGLRRAVDVLRTHDVQHVSLGGHSYGGRQASMLAAEDGGVAESLLLLSYPLHPPKRPDQLRTAHFESLRTPAFFISGSRDGFGTADELAAALKIIPAKTELMIVASAGHELMSKRNAHELPDTVVQAFSTFISRNIYI